MTSPEFFAHLASRSGEAFSPSRPGLVQRALNSLGLIPTYAGEVRAIDAAYILVTLCLCPFSRPALIRDWIEAKQAEWGSSYGQNLFVVMAWLLKKKAKSIQDIAFAPALGVMVVTFLDGSIAVYPESTDMGMLRRYSEGHIQQSITLPGAVVEEIAEVVAEPEKVEANG